MPNPQTLPLRDIHLPPAPGWWPPALGWWCVLGLLVLMVAGWVLWQRHKGRVRRSAITLARQELLAIQAHYTREQDAKSAIQAASVLVRRLSISLFPHHNSAGLIGNDWLDFLDSQVGQRIFCARAGRLMLEAPYRRVVQPAEAQSLLLLCGQWLEAAARVPQAR